MSTTDNGRATLDTSLTERVWQDTVVALAKQHGWLVYHTHDSRRSQPGFPDLCCVKGGHILFMELKTQRGRIRPEQQIWLEALEDADIVDVVVARPADWDLVQDMLAGEVVAW